MCRILFYRRINQTLHHIANVLKWSLLALSFGSLFISVYLFLQTRCFEIDWSPDLEAHCEKAFRFLELFVLSATAYIALQVYATSRKTKEVDVSIKIRELLNGTTCEEVYRYIDKQANSDSSTTCGKSDEPESVKYDEYELDIYLGTLEELYLLYQHDIISSTQMERQFGYHLRSIAKEKNVMKKLTIEEAKYWDGLVKLIQEFAPYEYEKTMHEL